jgi:hypothetical protein
VGWSGDGEDALRAPADVVEVLMRWGWSGMRAVISFQFHSRVRYLSTYYICPSACMMSWIRQRVKIQSLHTCMPCLILPRTVLKLVGEDGCFFRSCSYLMIGRGKVR